MKATVLLARDMSSVHCQRQTAVARDAMLLSSWVHTVTLARTVTPYRDSVDGTRGRVTYQKLVTRSRYGLVRRAVGIWP